MQTINYFTNSRSFHKSFLFSKFKTVKCVEMLRETLAEPYVN